jgi:simple sugar transport system ATP-binding protein
MLVGLVGPMNMLENAILRDCDNPEVSKKGILNQKAIAERTNRFVEAHNIKHAGVQRPVSLMSGGNLQKLLLAREVNGDPDVIVAAYPVHGVDIGATNAIHETLLNERKRGAAILMISEDLEELFMMSDRIAVLFEGRITGIVDVPSKVTQADYDHIGHLMVGNVEAAAGENGGNAE